MALIIWYCNSFTK